MHKRSSFLPLVVFLFGSEGSEGKTSMSSGACNVIILFLPLCLPKNPLLFYNVKQQLAQKKKKGNKKC